MSVLYVTNLDQDMSSNLYKVIEEELKVIVNY